MKQESRAELEARIREKWKNATITNNFVFSILMEDEVYAKELIEILLDIKVEKIVNLESEKTLSAQVEGKNVRLDFYLLTEEDVFNLEMQTTKDEGIEKRSRHYQGMMDINFLKKGQSYLALPNSYVVFICTFDPFGDGIPIYTGKTIFEETGKVSNDGITKVYINITGWKEIEKESKRAFCSYVAGNQVTHPFAKETHERVKNILNNDKLEVNYMRYEIEMNENWYKGMQEGMEKGVEKGMEKGMEKGKIEIAKNLLDILDNSMIALKTGLTLSEIQELRNAN